MEIYMPKPIVFRNSRLLIGIVLSGSVVAMLTAATMLMMALSALLHLHGYTLERIGGVLGWSIGAASSLFVASWLWRRGRRMSHYEARLDDNGVDFLLGTRRSPKELFFPWDKISAIRRERTGKVRNYHVEGSDETYVKFTSRTFFRSEKLVRIIAARARQKIRDI